MCKKLDRASTYVFFRDLLLTLLGLGFYKKSCLKEGEVCGKFFFRYCHACHTLC